MERIAPSRNVTPSKTTTLLLIISFETKPEFSESLNYLPLEDEHKRRDVHTTRIKEEEEEEVKDERGREINKGSRQNNSLGLSRSREPP